VIGRELSDNIRDWGQEMGEAQSEEFFGDEGNQGLTALSSLPWDADLSLNMSCEKKI